MSALGHVAASHIGACSRITHSVRLSVAMDAVHHQPDTRQFTSEKMYSNSRLDMGAIQLNTFRTRHLFADTTTPNHWNSVLTVKLRRSPAPAPQLEAAGSHWEERQRQLQSHPPRGVGGWDRGLAPQGPRADLASQLQAVK